MRGDPDFEGDERHFLYREYLRILIDHRPPVFVMENVKGLLSAQVNGRMMVKQIFKDLSSPMDAIRGNGNGLHYTLFPLTCLQEQHGEPDPRSFVIEAEHYGVPQARHRMFIMGVRSDVTIRPFLLKKKETPTLGQVIGTMPKIRSGLSKHEDSCDLWKDILAAASTSVWLKSRDKKSQHLKGKIKSAVKEIQRSRLNTAETSYKPPNVMRSWYYDGRLNVSTSHEARSHMESDLHRYLFVSAYGAALDKSPTLSDFPVELLPAHKNVDRTGKENSFSDRFRVQLESKVSTTMTSHLSKDGQLLHPLRSCSMPKPFGERSCPASDIS